MYPNVLKGTGLALAPARDAGIDLRNLQSIVGQERVATPWPVPLPLEQALLKAGQYTPSFYNFDFNLFDGNAEDEQIREFNESKWAVIPVNMRYGALVERPEDMKAVLVIQLPYRSNRPLYRVGLKFEKNLEQKWRVQATAGDFFVYRHL
jgi:hypothetical protein